MIRTNISLTDTQYQELKERAYKDKKSMSEIIRDLLGGDLERAVKDYKPQKDARIGETKKNSVSTGDSKPPSLGSSPSSPALKGSICEHGVPQLLCKKCMFK